MNENIDLTKILKDCPKGWKFYSSVFGEVVFKGLYYDQKVTTIRVSDCSGSYKVYTKEGIYYCCGAGECTLFPSKDQRDWSKFTAPWYKKEKFDSKTLKPFDRVLIREDCNDEWACDMFSHLQNEIHSFICTGSCSHDFCIPYNDDTKHLVGTTDEAPEYYRYWED